MTSASSRSPAQAQNALQARWAQLAPRERNLLSVAAAVILTALLWQLLLAPSLRTLRTAPAQALALDAQLQHMQSLQAQAKALQQQAPLSYDDALRALNQATRQTLGTGAQISVSAERATVTLQMVNADALAQWLTQSRLNARAAPLEARLNRTPSPSGSAWSGVVVMGLPQR